jgi:cleavage and polyadenylation specificity factor subunit 3
MASSDSVMEIMPLGAGEEVGRSCCILKFMGKTVLFDCGVHPAYSGMAALPFFDAIDTDQIDLVLITHFHLDHAAGLPYLMERTEFNPKARVFMTQPTRAIYKTLLSDFVRVSRNSPGDESLYTEEDVDRTMSRIEVLDYHAEVNVDGIKFRAFYAAHVLGAAMFMVEIAGVRVLYTGDFSREEDRHLKAAEIPPFRPDVLICESTYGLQVHESQRIRETRFTDHVSRIVRDGGRVLLPVFALGRAQELLLILDEYWESNPDLQRIPIYYASAIAQRCMPVYQAYINMMNDNVRRRFEVSNPFDFKFVKNVRGKDGFDDDGPCVFMASPGMLQNGLSRELFERWCGNKRNGLMLTGYSVDGTLAKKVLNCPETITRLDGREVKLACSVTYVTFAAHTDCKQTTAFVEDLAPTHTVLVHGERNNMSRLRGHLDGFFNGKTPAAEKRPSMRLYTPSNCQTVKLTFQDVKTAKAIGVLPDSGSGPELRSGSRVSGVLIKQDFAYTLIRPDDLPQYTSFKVSKIDQHQTVPLGNKPLITLATQLKSMFRNVQYDEVRRAMLVGDSVLIDAKGEEGVRISWASGHATDIMADAIAAVVLSESPHAKTEGGIMPHESVEAALQVGRRMLASRFGPVHKVKGCPEKSRLVIDLCEVTVNHVTGDVQCRNERIRDRVRMAYRRIQAAIFPIPDLFCSCCC